MFDINSAVASYTTPDLLAVIVLGVIGGIFGSLYNYLVDKVLRTYSIINEYALVIFLLITRILLVSFVTKKVPSCVVAITKIYCSIYSDNYPSLV